MISSLKLVAPTLGSGRAISVQLRMYLPLAALGAEALATITGFGAATLFLPFALLVLPATDAVVTTALFQFALTQPSVFPLPDPRRCG